MRFLVDECTGPAVARWLSEQGHDVVSVYETARDLNDETIIQKAHTEKRILITNDKDFGDKIYRQRYPHCGVILLRLEDERASQKIAVLRRLLITYAQQLENQFVVVTETRVRFGRH